ncbi:MAG: hypothetical protein K1X44_07465 [Alphaproteobacteria bacterium]|nr:hypothetical protein [Alphaproteobacteria bacterium]
MVHLYPVLTTFNSGEWSPILHGRIDLPKYQNACKTLLNFIPLPQGAATRRPGTHFVAETKNNKKVKLIPFEYSTSQAYIIEAGDQYFRFYKDRGRIEDPPGLPIEIVTPFREEDLKDLKWVQSADVLYLCHPLYAPRKLSRYSHIKWSLDEIKFKDGPYLDDNITLTTLTINGTTGNITITASAALWSADDIGRLVRIRFHTSNVLVWGSAKIISYVNSTMVNAVVDPDFPFSQTGGTTKWKLGAWSDSLGWPSCVTFYEERLFFAHSKSQPQTIWASVSGDYERFSPTSNGSVSLQESAQILSDSSLVFTISDDRVNAIRWMSAGKTLAIGTSGGEFNVQTSTLNEALTPNNITIRREGTIGSSNHMAIRINQAVLYIQRAGRKLYEMAYNFEADSYISPEMTIMARHLTQKGMVEMTYQQEPWSILWVIISDGTLLGFTYMRDQEVIGWHQHILGGVGSKILSLSTISGLNQDELWLVVERTINNQIKHFIEYLGNEFNPKDENDKNECCFMDSALFYEGRAIQKVTGIDHLKGERVDILCDGAVHPERIVDGNGEITLDYPAQKIYVGLGYKSLLETLDFNFGFPLSSTVGKTKKINQLYINFLSTLGGKIGFDQTSMDEIVLRKMTMPMDKSPPLFSGIKTILFPKGWDKESRLIISQDQPLPMTILSIVSDISLMEK